MSQKKGTKKTDLYTKISEISEKGINYRKILVIEVLEQDKRLILSLNKEKQLMHAINKGRNL